MDYKESNHLTAPHKLIHTWQMHMFLLFLQQRYPIPRDYFHYPVFEWHWEKIAKVDAEWMCTRLTWGTINIFIPSEDQVSENSSMAHRNSGRSAKEHGVQESICLSGFICSFNSANKSNITSLFCCSSEGDKVQMPVFLYLYDLLDSLLHCRGHTAITFSPYIWRLSSTWVFSVSYKRWILQSFP